MHATRVGRVGVFFRVCVAQPVCGGHASQGVRSHARACGVCFLGFAWPCLCVGGMLFRVCAAQPVRVGSYQYIGISMSISMSMNIGIGTGFGFGIVMGVSIPR